MLLSLHILEKIGIVAGALNVAVITTLVVYSIIHWKKLDHFRILVWIAALSLLQIITVHFLSPIIYYILNKRIDHSKSIYVCFEFTLLLLAFLHMIDNGTIKKLIKVLIFSSVIGTIYSFLYQPSFVTSNYTLVSIVESFIMISLSFIAYTQLLNTEIVFELNKSPDFYAITAVFFLFSFSLPFFLFENYFYKTYPLKLVDAFVSAMNLSFYTVFFFLSLIAIRCKVKFQK